VQKTELQMGEIARSQFGFFSAKSNDIQTGS
jgi:hypothetical protein